VLAEAHRGVPKNLNAQRAKRGSQKNQGRKSNDRKKKKKGGSETEGFLGAGQDLSYSRGGERLSPSSEGKQIKKNPVDDGNGTIQGSTPYRDKGGRQWFQEERVFEIVAPHGRLRGAGSSWQKKGLFIMTRKSKKKNRSGGPRSTPSKN